MQPVIVIGGNFGVSPKASRIVEKLAENLSAEMINGGTLKELQSISLKGYKTIIWMANVDNNEEKYYPQKDIGAVLIVSKVDRGSRIDAVSRIFKMHGNAVIRILKEKDPFTFQLIDALNNTWEESTEIEKIGTKIKEFAKWSIGSIRQSLKKNTDLEKLVELTRIVADNFENKHNRFFGNCSTRCQKMFPSTRTFFSKRNTNKKRLEIEDMVYVEDGKYFGEKPSVDTPVQLALYEKNQEINFMIHGHGYIKDAPITKHYYPCGDLREVPECNKIMFGTDHGVINLKNHGFLIYGNNTAQLTEMIEKIEFQSI